MEGEDGVVAIGLPALGCLTHDLLLVPVVVGQCVEEDVLDLRTLILLSVVGIDGDGIVDVVLESTTCGRPRGTRTT